MEILAKAAIVGLAGSVFALLLKKDSPAISFVITAGMGAVILYIVFGAARNVLDFLNELSGSAGVSAPAMSAVCKALCIAVVTKISADVCKDASQHAAASAVETVGAMTAFYISIPFMKTVFRMIQELM